MPLTTATKTDAVKTSARSKCYEPTVYSRAAFVDRRAAQLSICQRSTQREVG
jgi:hypothetical protein